MKQQAKVSLLICAVAALCAGGCANHEVVKQEQLMPAASSVSTSAAKPAASVAVEPGAGKAATAATSQAQPRQAAAAARTEVVKAALEKVFFDFDAYTLSPKAREVLTKNAEILKQQAGSKIRIEGNCDERGSDEYNLALGQKRAESALNYLKSLGISAERLAAVSYGKEKPADQGHDEAAMAKNRRDEFVVSSK